MSFKFRNSRNPGDMPILDYNIIQNSQTIKVGQLVKLVGGFVDHIDAVTDEIYGVVNQIVDANGSPVEFDAGTLDEYTSASDNQTNAKVMAGVDTNPENLYFGDVVGATLTDADVLKYLNVDTAVTPIGSQLDDSTLSTSIEQVQIVKVDPDNNGSATEVLFKIAESQID